MIQRTLCVSAVVSILFARSLFTAAMDYKEAIEHFQKALIDAPQKQRSELTLKLAHAYYRDQEEERSFKVYLEALDEATVTPHAKVMAEEQELYEKALALYSDATSAPAQHVAEQLCEKYAQILTDHPDYHLLGFILAASHANLGKYEPFFDRFYESYRHYPDHFMVYKTRGVLQLKLMECARTWEEKTKYREEAINSFVKALDKYPRDIVVYRLIVSLAKEAQKTQQITATLYRLLDQQIEIPRSDICPYVQVAVMCGDEALAEKLVLRGEQLYAFSRAVKVARDYLEQFRQPRK